MYKYLERGTRGFTLIELLVVIAIIGILASVVLAGLGSQRAKAREASALSTVRSVVPVMQICRDGGGSVVNATPAEGANICSVTSVVAETFPALPLNWSYGAVTHVGDDGFSFTAVTGGAAIFTCTQTGCVRT